eukprot:1195479-Prorocentrum_minimum.AAC.6
MSRAQRLLFAALFTCYAAAQDLVPACTAINETFYPVNRSGIKRYVRLGGAFDLSGKWRDVSEGTRVDILPNRVWLEACAYTLRCCDEMQPRRLTMGVMFCRARRRLLPCPYNVVGAF